MSRDPIVKYVRAYRDARKVTRNGMRKMMGEYGRLLLFLLLLTLLIALTGAL